MRVRKSLVQQAKARFVVTVLTSLSRPEMLIR